MTSATRHWMIALGVVTVVGLVIIGCQSNSRNADMQPAPGEDANATSLAFAADQGESAVVAPGARLWEQNCIRCHNPRTPASLSDTQWSVVMHHMRVRAGLTAEEHESILRFLQAAN